MFNIVFFLYFRSKYGFKIVALNISVNNKNKSKHNNNNNKNRHQNPAVATLLQTAPRQLSVALTGRRAVLARLEPA